MRRRTRVKLTAALVLALSGPAGAEPRAEFVGSFRWGQNLHGFGGLSSIELGPGGRHYVTISDSADVFEGDFTRDTAGKVIAVTIAARGRLVAQNGRPLQDPLDDAEGLAIGPKGAMYVSFETEDRIVQYGERGQAWIRQLQPRDFAAFEENGGIEALAVDARGRLFALPERSEFMPGLIPVYRYDRDGWSTPFTLRRDGRWRPVGADFGPDGRLFLLERDFWPLLGFMTRIRMITLDGDRVVADQVLAETSPGVHDNLEGIAVWTDADGAIRLSMVSDNNFLRFQRIEVVDYRLIE